MSAPELLGALLVVVSVASFTLVTVRIVREKNGPVARHYANLSLPCGLVPLLAALVIAGPLHGLGIAVLIAGFQLVAGTAESHIAGRLTWLRDRAAQDDPERRRARPGAAEGAR